MDLTGSESLQESSDLRQANEFLDTMMENDQVLADQLQSIHERRRQNDGTTAMSFAVVLIDGNRYGFEEDLLGQGAEGGKKLAERLSDQVSTYVLSLEISVSQLGVRIFLDLEGLARHLEDFGIPKAVVRDFVIGFNDSQPLFEFVGVGKGTPPASLKLEENLKFFIQDTRCKHILLGRCPNGVYAPNLPAWASQSAVASKVSLIKHPHFAEMIFLSSPPVTLNGIFGHTKQMQPLDPHAAAPPWQLSRGDRTRPLLVYVNKWKQRIDTSFPMVERDVMDWLDHLPKRDRPCNIHHLLGTCSGGPCLRGYSHMRITQREIEAITVRSRFTKCPDGSMCRDPRCLLGHHCAFDLDKRPYNFRGECRFISNHAINRTITHVLRN